MLELVLLGHRMHLGSALGIQLAIRPETLLSS
jgi:hypothetical protein